MICNEWLIAPRCKLEHPDIAQIKARAFFQRLHKGVRVVRG
jgi:hypothetical protein